MLRRYPFLVLSACVLCFSLQPCRADEYAAPQGQIAIARPEISWSIWATNGRVIVQTEMRLDGQQVAAIYQKTKRALLYSPAQPLTVGAHSVACRVQLDNGAIAQRTWEFSVAPDALPNLPAPSSQQLALFQSANFYRRLMGLPDLTLNAALCATAQAHCEYAEKNPGEAHTETEGKPGFRGKTASDRARMMGYSGRITEDMGWGGPPEEAILGLVAAPYHRLPFMEPGSPDFGGGFLIRKGKDRQNRDTITTLNFQGKGGKGIVLYPVAEQTNVPLEFYGNENPNPLRLHSASRQTGYVITLAAFGFDNPFRFIRAALTDSSGNAVPFWVNSPENDTHLKNAVFVIPHKPLRPSTTYRVKINFSLGSQEIEREWQFTTRRKSTDLSYASGAGSQQTPKNRSFRPIRRLWRKVCFLLWVRLSGWIRSIPTGNAKCGRITDRT